MKRASTYLLTACLALALAPLRAALYPRLTGAADRRLLLMSEATHFMALETHHARLFRAVQEFILED